MEILKDSDLKTNYHLEKGKYCGRCFKLEIIRKLAYLITKQKELLEEMRKLNIEVRVHDIKGILAQLTVQPTLIEKNKKNTKKWP